MEEFEVKRGSTKDLASRIPIELARHFGSDPEPAGDGYAIAYGAIRRLIATPGPEGKTLRVEIETDMSVEDDAGDPGHDSKAKRISGIRDRLLLKGAGQAVEKEGRGLITRS